MMRFAPVLLAAAGCLCSATRPFTAEDTVAGQTIGDVQVSPEGKWIVFSLTEADLAANKNRSRLMRIEAARGAAERLESAPEGAANVRWSPDGSRLAFIAGEGKSEAVYTLDFASGKLARVCDYARGNSFLSKAGNMLSWSPDGKRLAFAGTLDPEPASQDPLVITRILYKTRTSFSDNRRAHIYVVEAAGGQPRALTSGNHDEHSIDWGAGGEIVFLSNHERDPDARLNYDIFAVNPDSAATRQITHTQGVEMEPRVSPDGRSIAYTATKGAITTIDSVAEDAHAWIIPAAGGEGTELNAALDRRTSGVEWSADGKRIVYTAADHGSMVICTTFTATKETSCAIGKGAQAGAPAMARDGSLTYTLSKPDMPAELFRLDPGEREPRQLTHFNSEFAAARRLSRPEDIQFRSWDGTMVEGWLYPALKTSAYTPLILTIHGGPHGQFGYAFNPQAQFYAARGYAVLAINPRGSSGYGQKFSNGSVGNWGGGDYKDLMAGLDAVLKTHPSIDAHNLFVTGGSYGGFMTNWIITQTNRFKAAVALYSLSDLVSFYATSLYQDLIHAEFGGFPWADGHYALLWKWSPLAYVQNAVTPTMFLHGENDNDVHITQAEQMYTALRERGIEAELVRYPREGHGFHEPKHRVDAAARTVAWFDRFALK